MGVLTWVDDRRILSGLVIVNPQRLQWCDARAENGPQPSTTASWAEPAPGVKRIVARLAA